MPRAPQPATAITSHRVRPEKVGAYIKVQAAMTDAARRFPGFVGTEILDPVPGLQEEWVAIFRLESNNSMKRWLESPERLKLVPRIEELLQEPSHLLLLASDDRADPPVAMVFTHRVEPDKVPAYLDWRRRTIAAQAHYPGYLATEFFEPHGQFEEWVDIVRYNSLDALTGWMESQERKDLFKELETLVVSVHQHQVTGLEGWFALNRGPAATSSAIPSWKQALAVLFALYPTVMFLLFLNPLMRGWPMPVQMLIGNILSVSALTWLVMPRVSQFLNFWLSSNYRSWRIEILGLGTLAIGLTFFVLLFRVLFKA